MKTLASSSNPHLRHAIPAASSLTRLATHILIVALLLLPLATFAEEVRIAVGLNPDAALALIKKNGGKNITPELEIVDPKNQTVVTGVYWTFPDYDAIIGLSVRSGTVVHISYWTKKDFSESKTHRAQTEQDIKALKLDTTTKKVTIEKK